jgi:photosystem II stability/assembly factor-like uncharacterized protein
LLRSTDAGATWTDLSENLPDALGIGALSFDTPASGWFVAESSSESQRRLLALHTADGGLHWSEHALTTEFGETSAGIDFLDASRGVVVLFDLRPFNQPATIGRSFATADGGEHWTETVHPEPIIGLSNVELLP